MHGLMSFSLNSLAGVQESKEHEYQEKLVASERERKLQEKQLEQEERLAQVSGWTRVGGWANVVGGESTNRH